MQDKYSKYSVPYSFLFAFLYYFFLFFSFFFYLLYFENSIESNIIDYKNDNFSGVYFATLVVNPQNLTRFFTTYKSWGCSIQFYSNESIFVPISTRKIIKWKRKQITYYLNGNMKFSSNLILGYKEGMLDFISNTSLKWFFRLTDDVYVNIHNFANFIQNLENEYNPLHDKVIKGQLCNGIFLHGGSGWIMSRKAVEEVLKIWDEVPIDPNLADDVFAPKLWKKAGIDILDTNSKDFLGSPIDYPDINYLENHQWSYFRKCPTTPHFHLKEISVWHAGSQSMSIVVHGNELMDEMPNLLSGIINQNGKLSLCIES